MYRTIFGICLLAASSCNSTQTETQDAVPGIADAYVEAYSAHFPARMMFYGLPYNDKAVFNANDPTSIAAWRETQSTLLGRLKTIKPDSLSIEDRLTYANLRELIEADLQQEVCKNELWALDYYTGWQTMLPMYFSGYVETHKDNLDTDRLDAWANAIADYLAQEKANLARGIAEGYTAPASLARRVAGQVEALASDNASSLEGPVADLSDAALSAHWQALRSSVITPALNEFSRYLNDEYAPATRVEHSLSLNTDGVACFKAKLRYYTSLDFKPEDKLQQAREVRSHASARFLELGSTVYGLNGRTQILHALQEDHSADFQGTDEDIMAAAQQMADRLIEKTRGYFPPLPDHKVVILPYDEASIAAGARASYAGPLDDSYDGRYYLNPQSRDARSSFQLEVTSVHEVAPGHHMQTMVSLHNERAMGDRHLVNRISFIPAYVEGWGNYAEALAMEEGLFSNPRSLLVEYSTLGRAYFGEIMLHLGGTDEEFRSLYTSELENGSVTEDYLDAALDRLAMWPGHTSSYTIGGLAIKEMREKAKTGLGECFSLPEFHRVVLENSSVPLWFIEERVEDWAERIDGNCEGAR